MFKCSCTTAIESVDSCVIHGNGISKESEKKFYEKAFSTKQKTSSLRESIGQVLLDCARPLHVGGRHMMCREGVDQILLAVKEALPEKKMRPCGFQDSIGSDGVPTKPEIIYAVNEYQKGWNSCREEMEKRCE